MLRILYRDEHLVAIHKPPGLLVHRSWISTDEVFALQMLRDQIGQHVYPVHRLDRGTAGVLLFALSSEVGRLLTEAFTQRQIEKTYLAIVRGFIPEAGVVDHPLAKDDTGELQPAVTAYRRLATATLDIPVDRYPQSRYSLAEVKPETGRMHQIRRHFAHIRHPIIGDKKRGDRHHNRMFAEVLGISMMLLLAWKVSLKHPVTGENLLISTDPEARMLEVFSRLSWEWPLP